MYMYVFCVCMWWVYKCMCATFTYSVYTVYTVYTIQYIYAYTHMYAYLYI